MPPSRKMKNFGARSLRPQPAMKHGVSIESSFAQGFAAHKAGRLQEAQQHYANVLLQAPEHFDALHLLGVIKQQNGLDQECVDLISRAIAVNPLLPQSYSNLGISLKRLGKIQAAVDAYGEALALQPDYVEGYYNRGNAHQEAGQFEMAEADYKKAIELRPGYADAHYNLGNVLKAQHKLIESHNAYVLAIQSRPDYAEAFNNRGLVLDELGRRDEAIVSYQQALRLKPGFAGAWANLGVALHKSSRNEEALTCQEQAIASDSSYIDAYFNRGIVLQDMRRTDEAMASYREAIARNPEHHQALTNLGLLLQGQGKTLQAIDCFDRAVAARPDYAEAYCNRGVAYQDILELDKAIESFDRAALANPDFVEAPWNKALVLLLKGDYGRGWPLYESRWRWNKFTTPTPNFSQPLWLGDASIEGKTVLLHAEQGLGDTIQFCRYARLVKDRGARVVLRAQAALLPLLRQLDGVDEWVDANGPLPQFDYHCPLMSLPLAFQTGLDTIPFAGGYLRAPSEALRTWSESLGPKAKLRVGLAWSGSPTHKNDHNRSIPLEEVLQQLPVGPEYVSLQRDVRSADLAALDASHLLHFGPQLRDFADTAALCELMDVVVSVDTSVAHLAGALGKPTCVLLPRVPDWRWLLDRNTSPWYSRATLIRQGQTGGWQEPLQSISRVIQRGVEGFPSFC